MIKWKLEWVLITVYHGVGVSNSGAHIAWQAERHNGVPVIAVPAEHPLAQTVTHKI